MLPAPAILVVDDEESYHDLLGARLSSLEFSGDIIDAFDGDEAVNWLSASRRPTLLVFLDLRMPRMSGQEVLERLASGAVGAPPPVCITSSSTHPDDLALADRYDFVVAYFDKAPSAGELWGKAISELGFGQYFRPPV